MDKRINCPILTLDLKGKAAEKPKSRAFNVHLYLNKVKDKQERKFTHTYNLIKGKNVMEANK